MSRKIKQLTLTALLASSVTLAGCAPIMNFGDMMWTGTKNLTVKSGQKVASLLRPRAEREEPVFVFNERETVDTQTQTEPQVFTTGSTMQHQYYGDQTASHSSQPITYVGQTSSDYAATSYSTSTATQPAYGSSTYYSQPYEPATSSYSSDSYASTSYGATNYASTNYGGASYTRSSAVDYSYSPDQYTDQYSSPSTGQTYYYGPDSVQPVEAQTYASSSYNSGLPDLSYVKLSGQTSVSDWQSCQAQAGGYIEPEGNGYKIRSAFDYCMRVNGYMPESEAVQYMDRQTLP